MPDNDLAALVQGNTLSATKSEKACPYCKAKILLRAQLCKYCGGDVTTATLQGNNWKREPASDGQCLILRKLKVNKPNSLSKGQAAGIIADARENNSPIFNNTNPAMSKRKKSGSGCTSIIILSVLLIVVAIGALKHFGKLDEATNLVKRLLAETKEKINQIETPSASSLPTAGAIPDSSNTDDSGYSPDRSIVNEPTPESPASPGAVATPLMPETAEENALTAKFRSEFNPPKIGSRIILQLKNGKVMQDLLMELDDDGLLIKRGVASIRIDKKQLSDQACATLYINDYIAYRLLLNERYLAQADDRANAASKYLDEEKKRNERASMFRKKTSSHTSGPTTSRGVESKRTTANITSTPPTRRDKANVTSGKMSMKDWMEKYNQNNARLLARQKRVQNYEKKVQENGLEH